MWTGPHITIVVLLTIVLVAVLFVLAILSAFVYEIRHAVGPILSLFTRASNITDQILQMMKLWIDHFFYTRLAVEETASGYAGASATITRLYDNQTQLGNNFSELFGAEAGNTYTALLKKHIDIALQIVVAAMKNQDTTALYQSWVDNANQIAELLNKYIPALSLDKIKAFMQGHLETTLAEAKAILTKNYDQSIKAGDVAENHILDMVNYIRSVLSK